MGYSRIRFPGDGVTDTFNVVFTLGQISEEDVTAYVEGEVDGSGNPVPRPITFLSPTSIVLGGDIPSTNGKVITFDRTVDKDRLLVDYEDGDIMNEENLNTSQKQMIMAVHEVLDGRFSTATQNFDMGGNRIVNVGEPIDPSDATTKNYVDTRIESNQEAVDEVRDMRDETIGYRNQTLGFRNQAAQEASDASDSADRAEEAVGTILSMVPAAFPPTRAAASVLPDTISHAYLVEPGHDGLFETVDTSTGEYADLLAADTYGGDIIPKTSPNLAYLRRRVNGNYIKTSEYGHNLHVAVAAASERAKLMGPDTVVDVEMNWYGTRALTDSALILPANVSLVGLGNGITKLDISSLTVGQLVAFATGQISSAGRIAIDARANPGNPIGDAYTELPEFNPILKDSMSVEFLSATGLKEGDVFITLDNADYSWITVESRPQYKMGDRFEVTGVIPNAVGGVGDRVYVDHAFRDDYTYSATLRAHKQHMRRGRLGGFLVEAYDPLVTNMQAFEIAGWRGAEFFDLNFLGRAAYGISWSQCLDGRGNPGAFINMGVDRGTGNLYALLRNNCTRMFFKGGKAGSNWHATDDGGGAQFGNVLNYRNIWEDYDLFGSDINVAGMASMHGNSDLVGYIRCNAIQAHLNGRDPYYKDGWISNLNAGAAVGLNRLVHCGELIAGKVTLDGTTLRSDRNTGTGSTSSAGMIRCVAGGDTRGEVFLSMDNVDVEAPNEQQPLVIGPLSSTENPVSLTLRGRYVVPAATAMGCVRVFGPSADLAVQASHLHIDVRDLPAGIPFQTNFSGTAGPTTFVERSFKRHGGPGNTGVWTSAATAVASETSGNINFRNPYPSDYLPICNAVLQSGDKGVKVTADVFLRTNSQIRVRVKTGDGTSTNAAAVDTAWWAE